MSRTKQLVLDASIDPSEPVEAQAVFTLDATSYSGDENTNIQIFIDRATRTDQQLTVDWAVTNASVIPAFGTALFLPGESQVSIVVAAQEVDTNELGDVTLANPLYVSGPVSNPLLGNPQTAAFSVVDTDQQLKGWHPGHYMKTQGDHSNPDQDAYFDPILTGSSGITRMDEIPETWGAFIAFAWGTLETTEGVYDWTRLDTAIAALEAMNGAFGHNYYIAVALEWKNFGQDNRSEQGLIDHAAQLAPDNITAAGDIYPYPDSAGDPNFPDAGTVSGFNCAVWETSVMTQWINFMQAFADRYDDNPTVEAVFTTETALSWKQEDPAGYSDEKYDQQIGRLIEAVGPMFSKTNVALGWNFGVWRDNTEVPSGNPVDEADLIELCYQNGVGLHGPDTDKDKALSKLFRGDGSGYGVTAIRDYRGTMYKSNVVSKPNLGGKDDLGSASNALEIHTHGIPNTHTFWVTTANGAQYDWDAIKAAIQVESSPVIGDSPCPSQYIGCQL